ncbi:FTSH5 [Symbiodinium necroappetens]|uniref:FTSH5 protein n=1 Tax=Symbiodinium necroappetens TaxID=1628268 RepID=A0A812Q0L9_9DINO|nr:FTSH5 [Symbiodinium necroappetens]
MPASPTDEGEASLECLTDDEDPCINTDPSAIMLNQLVEGCGGDRSLNGLLPHAQF